MKREQRALFMALALVGAAGGASAQAEMHRCPQADGSITFQATPCPLAQLVVPEPAPGAVAAPKPPVPTKPALAPVPAKPVVADRPVVVPEPVAVPSSALPSDEGFAKPSRRKREVLEATVQLERCRADAPGFAEKSAPVYAAWMRRHAAVLSEYDKLVASRVRAARRGEVGPTLRLCTEEWLRGIEPLSRQPDPRFQTVEKTWQVFMGALMTGDRGTAMSALSGSAEARWKQRVENLSDADLRRIGASIKALKVQWGDDYEKEGLVADVDNRVVSIGFRNVNEEWKIVEMGGATTIAQPVAPAASAPRPEVKD